MYNRTQVPSKANLAIYQGDDYSAVVTVANGNGLPPDLTGYTAKAQIRSGPADTNPDVIAELGVAIDVDTITLTMPATDTATLNGRYQWDLELTSPLGLKTTILAGAAIATGEVTR